MIRIGHLFISPGHNYYGQHGQPPGNHPIIEVESIECLAGRGIRGDRYLDHKPDYKGQITFFASEVLARLRDELGVPEAHPSATRRNVITAGVDLNTLVGVDFEVQGVRFFGTEECRPCYWMNNAFRDPRAEAWLKGNGGLRARILTDGVLRREF
jgi:MOSC domain-containing protein YiiM